MPTVEQRFWDKVRFTDPSGCWLWSAGRNADGYGTFANGPKKILAHAFAYRQLNGPIPEGLVHDHLCRVRHCVRPSHLEPVTRRENTLRGETLQAANAAKTKCNAGHQFDDANTYVDSHGWRKCRACGRSASARYKARKEAP